MPLRVSEIFNKDVLLVGLETLSGEKLSGAESKWNRVQIPETLGGKHFIEGEVGVVWEAEV